MKSNKEIVFNMIQRGLTDEDGDVREAAMRALSGRKALLETIECGLHDGNCDETRLAAIKACVGIEVPLEIIERGLNDFEPYIREAAMEACAGREVPLETIERWLNDEDYELRVAAMRACEMYRDSTESEILERWANKK